MDLSRMLSNAAQDSTGNPENKKQNHQPTSRQVGHPTDTYSHGRASAMSAQRNARGHQGSGSSSSSRASPVKKDQKQVVFQLVDPGHPTLQARLPMRVMLSPKDTTDSIITTVKNFWGLYETGVSFENKEGFSIIANYDNFEKDMTVYVRTVPLPPAALGEHARDSASPVKPSLGAPFEMRPTLHAGARSPSRSAARSAGVRSVSPQSEMGRRSVSTAPGGKSRLQRKQSRDNGALGDGEGYSSGIDDQGSVTSSRRSKAEEIKAEITVDNIVEGGRRKRAFESSELPLFVPPQIPISASISSTSPQRRNGPASAASPYAFSNQHTFSYQHPLPSPQSYTGGSHYAHGGIPSNPYQNNMARPLRGPRSSGASYSSHRHSNGVLPTPDPTTVGSVISDEDVALQLMRLGDPTAFSHGRTSTSTYDDAESGKADAASSDEAESDNNDEVMEGDLPTAVQHSRESTGPQRKKQRLMNDVPSDATSGDEYEDLHDGTFHASNDHPGAGHGDAKASKAKFKSRVPGALTGSGGIKASKPRTSSMSKPKKSATSSSTSTSTAAAAALAHGNNGGAKAPMSPASMPSASRKTSIASTINFQNQLGPNEEDLSSKPRCQRCRKSKKGCDRQRPCGRCKDAGIGIEGCISEDEGNGRKGRYGRHMNIPIKKGDEALLDGAAAGPLELLPASGSPTKMAPGGIAAQQQQQQQHLHIHPYPDARPHVHGLSGHAHAQHVHAHHIQQQQMVAAAAAPGGGYFLAPALPDKSKKRKK